MCNAHSVCVHNPVSSTSTKTKKKKCTQNKTNKILKVLAVPILNFEQQCAQPDLVRHEVSVLYLMENGVDTGLLD